MVKLYIILSQSKYILLRYFISKGINSIYFGFVLLESPPLLPPVEFINFSVGFSEGVVSPHSKGDYHNKYIPYQLHKPITRSG